MLQPLRLLYDFFWNSVPSYYLGRFLLKVQKGNCNLTFSSLTDLSALVRASVWWSCILNLSSFWCTNGENASFVSHHTVLWVIQGFSWIIVSPTSNVSSKTHMCWCYQGRRSISADNGMQKPECDSCHEIQFIQLLLNMFHFLLILVSPSVALSYPLSRNFYYCCMAMKIGCHRGI